MTHNGPLTDDQRMWVVLLSGPPGTMLFGLSAARYSGLKGLSPDHLSIVIPGASRSCRRRQLVLPEDWDVDLHWSTKLGPEDVHPTAVPPRTRLPRSIIGSATERVPPRRARVIVLAGVQQRLVRPALLPRRRLAGLRDRDWDPRHPPLRGEKLGQRLAQAERHLHRGRLADLLVVRERHLGRRFGDQLVKMFRSRGWAGS